MSTSIEKSDFQFWYERVFFEVLVCGAVLRGSLSTQAVASSITPVANQAIHPLGVGKSVPEESGRTKHSLSTHSTPLRCSDEVECVAHPSHVTGLTNVHQFILYPSTNASKQLQ
ncbi:hypothetical protein Y032_0058g2947 [Ancylostoma ceylanicum]|uniref:Uncharacterized protein n=1 Tax=Ancylostoma ceylanicum TaxID=53326 RepID=A0A016U411_9BILA|nr:hypothetical protein Y032_0058g2947 [Ancylostoma ceylanicum]